MPLMSSSLLSTSEHQAFLSFLHTVDDADPDWQAFAALPPAPPNPLAKATKDLIALHPAPRHRPAPTPIAPAPAPPQQAPRPKRRRVSPPPRPPSPPPPRAAAPPKPTLLSTQQKKANHIQSEQKRRANIRRGYEALCGAVPALREALQEEECGEGRRSKRARGEEGERVDGRAGPRSESVVLQKTIEHICGLRDEQSALLARLERARAALGAGHPALAAQTPLWERTWDGGKGLMDDEDDEE